MRCEDHQLVLTSKLAKSANPPVDDPNPPEGASGRVGVGPCKDGSSMRTKKSPYNFVFYGSITMLGRGGAGRGGGCFAFFGGNAGLGDSGRGGGPPDLLVLGLIWLADVGACRMAKGSLPKSSFPG